jgi:hypothetical protein
VVIVNFVPLREKYAGTVKLKLVSASLSNQSYAMSVDVPLPVEEIV